MPQRVGATRFAAISKKVRPKLVRRLLSLLGGEASRKQFGRELLASHATE
jgi:hypothetical protein